MDVGSTTVNTPTPGSPSAAHSAPFNKEQLLSISKVILYIVHLTKLTWKFKSVLEIMKVPYQPKC